MGPSKSLQGVLYDLKKQFGLPGALYKTTSAAGDVRTGRISRTRVKYRIRRLVDLPQSYITTKIYALSYIAANKNFTYGGYFDKDTKIFLVDQKEIPGTSVALDDYLVLKHRRFDVKQTQAMEFDLGYIVVAEAVSGQPVDEVHEVTVYQKLRFGQSSDGSTT